MGVFARIRLVQRVSNRGNVMALVLVVFVRLLGLLY